MIDSIAIGRFDGLHLGHQKLFEKLGDNGAIALIDTKKSNLTPPNMLSKYTKLPVFAYLLDEIKDMDASQFVQMLKNDFPALKRIVVGEDFHFAKDRSGNADKLKELFEGETIVVSEHKIDGIGVHSRIIRAFLNDGKIKKANEFLGREYEICGQKVVGQGIGAQKLVATINIDVMAQMLPNEGVYATKTNVNGVTYPSVTFVGHRVSTDGNFAVETHILAKFDAQRIEEVCIRFVDKLRPNRFFGGMEELKTAIEKDIKSAKVILNKK